MSYALLISYDITDDDRRNRISNAPAAQGARVQYSVFEVTLPMKKAVQQLRGMLRKLINRDEDQIRLYPLSAPVSRPRGFRRLKQQAPERSERASDAGQRPFPSQSRR
ncbi:CRISPR-associated endonuclease Cas2 [Streptomyces sp. NBC_01483]|uniref:CRISPR-associated endonuclease Cas2 n=1 Tax=Streptomyces sp. NBC_01483 TaxID=2903883 RepID=UPI002E37900A|nr:CRISPR-associated endonuclease Cas2 [Streptomyces sp. NBC_01483]